MIVDFLFFCFFSSQLGDLHAKSENIMQHSPSPSFTPPHLGRNKFNKFIFSILLIAINFICRFSFIVALL